MFRAPGKSDASERINLLTCMLAILLGVATMALPVAPALAASIVIDPGHGGNDRGAGHGDAYTEKRFTLLLARMVAAELSAEHRIELTRTADIELDPTDRAGLANHLRVDLLVSLHGATAPYCSHRSATVYYHEDEHLVMPPALADQRTTVESNGEPVPWERLHNRHQAKSRAIATTIQQTLAADDVFDTVAVRPAPLAALMGADLPAVLIEMGCFHPATALTREQFEQGVNDYAKPLAASISAAVNELAP